MPAPRVYRAHCALVFFTGLVLWGTGLAQPRSAPTARWVQQDFVVEVRQVSGDGGQATTWSSSVGPGAGLTAQSVRVRNGERALLQWESSQALQWTQSLQWQPSTVGAAHPGMGLGGMVQGLVWMESGQSWSITPHWKGGKHAVQLEVEITVKHVDDRNGTELPAAQRQQLRTTVRAPLGQWVTLATTGQTPAPGSYRSDPQQGVRTELQVRTTLP